MSVPENASLMPFYTLSKGQVIRFTALDAAAGTDVSAVIISRMKIGVSTEPTAAPTTQPAFAPAYSQGDGAA